MKWSEQISSSGCLVAGVAIALRGLAIAATSQATDLVPNGIGASEQGRAVSRETLLPSMALVHSSTP